MCLSLSALVPVRNVQAVVEPALRRLLEILAELTRAVELIVLDDGSTDATGEVLSEMAVQYPQIKVFHFGRPRGWVEALRTGLAEARGQILFFEEPGCLLPWNQLPLLWNAAAKHLVVVGRSAGAGWQAHSHGTGSADDPSGGVAGRGTYQLVHRSVLFRLASRLTEGISFRQLLLQEGIAWQERILSGRLRPENEILYPNPTEPFSCRTDLPQQQTNPPNYLVHLVKEKPSVFSL